MPKIIDHQKYRQELLEKCFHLFAEKGFSSMTMRQLAKELGVSTGTLYHYFKSKEDIFLQLALFVGQKNLELSGQLTEPLPTLEERLESFLRFFMSNEGRWMRVFFILLDVIRNEVIKKEEFHKIYRREHERSVKWTADFLQTDNLVLVQHLIEYMQGMIAQRYMTGEKGNIDKRIEMAKKLFLPQL